MNNGFIDILKEALYINENIEDNIVLEFHKHKIEFRHYIKDEILKSNIYGRLQKYIIFRYEDIEKIKEIKLYLIKIKEANIENMSANKIEID